MLEQNATDFAMKPTVYVETAMLSLATNFIRNRRRDMQTLQEANEQGDFDTIRRLGHNFKGAGASYGFPLISVLGKEIEEAARDQQKAQVSSNITQLTSYLDRVEVLARQ